MKISIAVISALFAIGLSACGGDPLVGTWKDTTDPSASDDGSSAYSNTLVVDGSAKTITITEATTFGASAPAYAGCTETDTIAGTYTDTSTTVTLTLTSLSQGRTGCTDSNDNVDPAESVTGATSIEAALQATSNVIDGTYTISGSTLSFTDAIGGQSETTTYTKAS